MKIFPCQFCGQLLFFENTHCERCRRRLGFIAAQLRLAALEADGDLWRGESGTAAWRFCANAGYDACNWLIEAESGEALCAACRHNRTIPDLGISENLIRWRAIEGAKHRLFYSLLRFRLPLPTRQVDPESGLAFDFLADPPPQEGTPVATGHSQGVITVALNEADSVVREQQRQRMGETYRTLLGHFRHEIGHYFWDRLVRDSDQLEAFRALFGDERADYASALKAHYDAPDPAWRDRYISAYAASHPWEDFAESWAHFLHIVDALETAAVIGINVDAQIGRHQAIQASIDFDPYRASSTEQLVEAWLPLTFAINSINRSLGQPDLYPFVLTSPAVAKLSFIRALIENAREGGGNRRSEAKRA
ncbi:MAG TPA: putative zinc-binding peptidase [Stellaceae bacterium]|jgi:hypothetical protein|nr:putative zinc-binding peptidase [Stellaceae bacterium]